MGDNDNDDNNNNEENDVYILMTYAYNDDKYVCIYDTPSHFVCMCVPPTSPCPHRRGSCYADESTCTVALTGCGGQGSGQKGTATIRKGHGHGNGNGLEMEWKIG